MEDATKYGVRIESSQGGVKIEVFANNADSAIENYKKALEAVKIHNDVVSKKAAGSFQG